AVVRVCVRDLVGDRRDIWTDSGIGRGAGEYVGVVEGKRAERDFGPLRAKVEKWFGGGGICNGAGSARWGGTAAQGICAIAVGRSGLQRGAFDDHAYAVAENSLRRDSAADGVSTAGAGTIE